MPAFGDKPWEIFYVFCVGYFGYFKPHICPINTQERLDKMLLKFAEKTRGKI